MGRVKGLMTIDVIWGAPMQLTYQIVPLPRYTEELKRGKIDAGGTRVHDIAMILPRGVAA